MLYPLDAVCADSGYGCPMASIVSADAIPEPQQSLLVHSSSMTATLERFVDSPLLIRTLSSTLERRTYRRLVLLEAEDGRVVEMAALHVNLDELVPRIRKRILGEPTPFGRILIEERLDCRSTPTAFLAVTPHADMMDILAMTEPARLWGRRAEITAGDALIAQAIELLPPL